MGKKQSNIMKRKYTLRYTLMHHDRPKRVMLSIQRTENCLVFTTKTGSKSEFAKHRFYVVADSFNNALNTQKHFIVSDIYSFLEVTMHEDYISLSFSYIDRNGNTLKGTRHDMEVGYNFWEFCQNAKVEDTTTLLNRVRKNKPKVYFAESGMEVLKQIKEIPQLRKKFGKAIMQGFLAGDRAVTMYSDFSKYSFFFKKSDGISGGLILHDLKEGFDKAYYSVHT